MAILSEQRREVIRRLLASGQVKAQDDLVRMLKAQGYSATQSSISRDLRSLGAVRQNGRYVLPSRVSLPLGLDRSCVVAILPAGPHMLVVRTTIGSATRLALEVDNQGWEEVVGTVAGDDTVFIATPDAGAQTVLMKRLLPGVERG